MKIETSRRFLAKLASRRAARLFSAALVAGCLVAAASSKAQDSLDSVTGADLTMGTSYSQGLPNAADDVIFNSGSPTTLTLSAGAITVGSLDDTNTGVTTAVTNASTTTASTITLGGAGNLGNSVSGTTSDLIYVAPATSTIFTLNGGSTEALNFVMGQSGSFDVGTGSTLNMGTAGTAGTLGLGTFTLTTSGAGSTNIGDVISGTGTAGLIVNSTGTTTLSGNNTYSGTTTIGSGASLQITAAATETYGATGAVTDGGKLYLSPASTTTLTYGANISGGGTLTQLGAGTTNLTGSNSYSGGTTISTGLVSIATSGALGTGAVTITNSNAAGGTTSNLGALQITASGLTIANPFTISGGGVNGFSSGAALLQNLNSATDTLTGLITLAGNSVISNVGVNNTLNLNGGVTGPYALTLYGGGGATYTSTFVLGGSTASSYTGGTTLYAGSNNITLQLAGGALPDTVTTFVTTNTSGAGIRSFLDLNGHSQTLGGLSFTGTGTAAVENTANATATTLTLNPTGTQTFTGTIGTSTANTSNIALVASGTGTQVLAGANTFTGGTTISSGTLTLAGVGSLGTGNVAVNGGTLSLGNNSSNDNAGLTTLNTVTLASGTTLLINQTNTPLTYTAFPIKMNGSSSITFAGSNVYTDTFASPITLSNTGGGAQTATIGESDAANTINFTGLISGTGDFSVAPAGNGNPFNVSISQAETYSGNTFFYQTTTGDYTLFKLATGGALPATTVLTLSQNGTNRSVSLNLNSQNQTLAGLVSAGAGAASTSILGGGTLTINDTANYTFAGAITGTGTALTKSGAGTETLSGTNTYTGATQVTAGTLTGSTVGAIPTASTASVSSGAQLNLTAAGTYNTFPVGITGQGPTTTNFDPAGVGGALRFNIGNGLSATYGGAITLSGANAEISNFGITDTITLSGVISGAVTDSNGLVLGAGAAGSGQNNFVLTAAETYTGNTTILARAVNETVQLGTGGSLPSTTSLTLKTDTGLTVAFDLNGNSQTLAGLFDSPGLTTTVGTERVITSSATAGQVLTINNAAADSFGSSGGVLGGTGTNNNNFAVTKTGAGTLTLSGANTYTGATTVSGGALLLSNTTGSATGTGAVTVNTGATLAGTGISTGLLTIASGGSLTPGTTATTPGVLSVGPLTLSAGSNFNVFLSENSSMSGAGQGTAYSQVVSAGTLGNPVTLAGNLVLTMGTTLSIGDKFYILLNSGTAATGGAFATGTTGGTTVAGTTVTAGGDTFTINYADNGDSGTLANDVSLTVTAVPEPGTVAGLIAGLGLMGLAQRRRLGASLGLARRS
jgi:fibronectin-binding autotransporter adhesin